MPKSQYASHKNLIVYQKSKNLAVDVIKHFSGKKIPKNLDFVINQLIRALCSVGANIAEGYGRLYKGSQRQFYAIARGSSFEADYWIEVLTDSKMFGAGTLESFSERNSELSKMLTSLMKRIDTK